MPDEEDDDMDDLERARQEMRAKQQEKFSRFKSKDKIQEAEMKSRVMIQAEKDERHFKECVDHEPEVINCLPQLYMDDLQVTGKGPPPILDSKSKQRFAGACRSVIFRQCNAYKHKYFDRVEESDGIAVCPISKFLTGKRICVTRDAVHVEHS